ncbi:MAG: nucleotidyltransferase domain-containing protein [Peptococcaceae bacterium]|nr:nucleotidyltransferase domain-containing protein [Peptococcaceae bacterium]MDH7525989.1 nucleotidyltransferase domain-containing protein [Peptococcaceae bacterium]
MIVEKKIDFSGFEEKLNTFKNKLQEFAPPLVAAYLFGSCATGDIKPLSDIDIALLFDKNGHAQRMEAQILIEAMNTMGTEEIDLLVLNGAPLRIKYGVLRNRRLIFCSDKYKRADFETAVIMEYLDFARLRREFDREKIKKMGIRRGNCG